MPEVQTLFLALLGGILPALLWLWFWLGEDRLHPEPRRLIFASFLAGMAVVFLALLLEQYADSLLLGTTTILIAWSAIEEILKFGAAYFAGLHNKQCDEPIDPMIYLITAALGFAAAENSLFLISSISDSPINGLITGNLRFIGASLLHILGSGTIGVFFAYSFYKSKISKTLYLFVGLILAISLHSLFNFFIMKSNGGGTFLVFGSVWVAIVMLLAAFEKVKKLKTNTF